MNLSIPQLIGLLIGILGIAGLALYSGTRPRTRGGANVNGSPIIAGIIMGTLVGGSSTVGTAQLAYHYGLAAWWFTLGGGLACLVLALVYTVPWRKSGCMTLIGIIRKEFGASAGMLASLLSSVGTFINIISQLISGTAVIAVIAPALGLVPALVITAAFMALYVIVGGSQGAGLVGILKLALLYVSMVGCGIMVLVLCGGASGFGEMVAAIQNPDGVNFYSLFARGVWKDGGAALSKLKPYIIPGSDIDKRAQDALDGLSWAHTSSFKLTDFQFNGVLPLANNCYVCYVTATTDTYTYGKGEVTDVIDLSVIVYDDGATTLAFKVN